MAVLMQILQQNIRHYYQLQQMIQQGQNSQNYLRWLNSGMDDSHGLLNTPVLKDQRILGQLRQFREALKTVESIYGTPPRSPIERLQKLHDDTTAESLQMVNSMTDFSNIESRNSNIIAAEAHGASPRGAARMQAETSAEILRSLAVLIRLNTQILKMQSERLAMENKTSKDGVANFQKVGSDLTTGFADFKGHFGLEHF